MRLAFNEGVTRQQLLTWGGAAFAILLLVTFLWPERKREEAAAEAPAPPEPAFPVPPLPGQEAVVRPGPATADAAADSDNSRMEEEGTRA
jgi:NADH-quinone oxidoreductase subunit H